MSNTSLLQSNITQVSIPSSKLIEYARLTLIFLIILGFGSFTFFVAMILNVFFTTPHFRDNARYVLFVYMLFNDTIFLLLGFYFLFASIYKLLVPALLCFVLYTLASMAFRVTPYNLAAMAIEQYVAICHPLRHAELCTAYRAHVTFTIICIFSAIPHAVELCLMFASLTNIFNLNFTCSQNLQTVNHIKTVIETINLILCFTLAGIIILVTYVKIMLVAHRISSQSALASKAGRTIMLHAFQLLLCMASLLSILTESYLGKTPDLRPVTNFMLFNCLPRILSPVIYGISNEALRKHIKLSLSQFIHNFFGKKKEGRSLENQKSH